MRTEFELGLGIEELIQISITANFSMENYYGQTNPEFYETVMAYYEVLEDSLASFASDHDGQFAALDEAAAKHWYYESLLQGKQEAIGMYLAECQKIVQPFKPDFMCSKWYEEQHCTNVVQERAAIINLMGEIRKLEEEYMKKMNVLNAEQTVSKKKQLAFNRTRHGEPPRTSNLGGYMPYKKDMKNRSYFLSPERLRSIFDTSDKGDA